MAKRIETIAEMLAHGSVVSWNMRDTPTRAHGKYAIRLELTFLDGCHAEAGIWRVSGFQKRGKETIGASYCINRPYISAIPCQNRPVSGLLVKGAYGEA